ncbi:MAG: nucleotidyltransferase [Hydrogenophilales bacterium 28-61-23]|nr:MAG: nucleotidyltransferase [Hydrogenophilales bacterium 28-61-23]
MSDATPREWRFYVDDMNDFAQKVCAYTEGLDQAAFTASGLNYDATVRNLELIGEAATHIPEDVRLSHPQIPWRLIIAMRNRLIHGYLGIDNDTLWSVIKSDIPALLLQLQKLRKPAR